MRLSALRPAIWPFSASTTDAPVRSDADELMQCFGAAAFEVAQRKSVQEDLGFLSTGRPGHWGRVAREIGRRSGRHDTEPRADFAA